MILFDSLKELNVEIEVSVEIVDISSSAAEETYQDIDGLLAEQIYRIMQRALGIKNENKLFYINWDWFPNKSRSLMLSGTALTTSLVLELKALLTGVYNDWNIYITVCEDLTTDDCENLGEMCICSDRILFVRALQPLLTSGA